ncbi:hypothetical protein DFJ73DRAFT_372639 [Zopfochytrium polystomum]|nr:hypothetical protein DFJ73DRAFT_372639 [Zopfochytrium polystomum]
MSQRSMTQIRPMGMPTSSQMPISMPYSQGQRPIFRPGMGVNSSPLVIQGLHQGGHQIRPPQPTVPRITPTNITPEQLQHIQTLVQKKLALQNLAALFPNDPNVLANLRNVQQMLAPLGPVLQAYGGMARPAQMQVGGQYFQSDAHAAAAMVAIQNGQRQLMAENADRQRQLAMQQQQQQLSAALGPSANMGANLTTGGGAVMSAIPGFGLQQSLSGNGSFPGTSASFPVLGTGEVAGASELAADVAVDKAGKAAMPPGPVVSGTSSAPLPAPPPPPPSSTASPSPTPSKRKKK